MKTGALALIVIACLVSGASIGPPVSSENVAEASSDTVIHVLPDAIKDEIAPADVRVYGVAPKVTWRLVGEKGPRTFLIVLGKDDDLIAALYKFAQANHVKGASFSGLGAVGCSALGFFQKEKRAYKVIKIPQQLELASLTGNISLRGTKYVVHTHAVVSLDDGRALGGHVLYATAWPTVEIMLTETTAELQRQVDPETGLSLFDQAAITKESK